MKTKHRIASLVCVLDDCFSHGLTLVVVLSWTFCVLFLLNECGKFNMPSKHDAKINRFRVG